MSTLEPVMTPEDTKIKNLAYASLILGISSLVISIFGLNTIAAIITGHIVLAKAPKNHPQRTLGLIGMLLGYLMTVLTILAIIVFIMVYPIISPMLGITINGWPV